MRYAVIGILACTLLIGASPPNQQCSQMYLDATTPKVIDASDANAGRIFCHSFYSVSYSTQRKDPLWSAEHLTGDMARGGDQIARHNKRFSAQAGLSHSLQGSHDDYTHTNYDRGHMTPADDAKDLESQKDTFVVTNIVPQTPQLNEHMWYHLEAAVHRLAEDDGEVYIVTGPIFGDAPKLLHNRVEVPVATFKAIYDPRAGSGIAFIAANSSTPTCITVSLAELASRAGVDPFPSLPSPAKAATPALQLKPGWQMSGGHRSELPFPDCAPN